VRVALRDGEVCGPRLGLRRGAHEAGRARRVDGRDRRLVPLWLEISMTETGPTQKAVTGPLEKKGVVEYTKPPENQVPPHQRQPVQPAPKQGR
jgi:hypothetical protein